MLAATIYSAILRLGSLVLSSAPVAMAHVPFPFPSPSPSPVPPPPPHSSYDDSVRIEHMYPNADDSYYLNEKNACRLDAAACAWDSTSNVCRTLYIPAIDRNKVFRRLGQANKCRYLAPRIARAAVPSGAFNGCAKDKIHCKIEVGLRPNHLCMNSHNQLRVQDYACLRFEPDKFGESYIPEGAVCCMRKVRV